MPVTYVGHPLADMLAELPPADAVRDELRVPLDVPVVALLPGSRVSELENMAELFVRTAMKVHEDLPGVRFLAPFASLETKALFEAALSRVQPKDLNLTMMIGHSLEAMAAADVVLVASGTATLEAALLKRPMVITYRMPRLSWWLLRRRAYLPFVGMPNILAGEQIVPELLQDAATPENLADALVTLLSDDGVRARLDRHFEAMRKALRQNTAEKAAAAIMPLLSRMRPFRDAARGGRLVDEHADRSPFALGRRVDDARARGTRARARDSRLDRARRARAARASARSSPTG